MKVFIESGNKRKNLKFNGTVSQLLRELKINPETVIVAKNKGLVTEKEKLKDADSIQILSFVSGG